MTFCSEKDYIDKAVAEQNVSAIDALIQALLTTALTAVQSAAITEYKLSDGQTELRKLYRNPNEVLASIALLRVLRQSFINDATTYMTRLIGSENFQH